MSNSMTWAASAATLCLTLLSGCASAPRPLYGWGSYSNQVYSYFKGEDRQVQIAHLEADLEKIKANNQTPAPGLHAHLGMLYAEAGNDARAVQELQAEQQAFPESAPYLKSLLDKYQH